MEEDIAALIASKMQRMEEGQQLMRESLILEALNKGPPSPPPPPGPTPPPATSPTAQPQPGMKRVRKTRKVSLKMYSRPNGPGMYRGGDCTTFSRKLSSTLSLHDLEISDHESDVTG
ncbi:hypothetical protein AB205_0183190 [Aquarana catesbeiana]|uniref:Uncharacterized protein n=1 Tax=Aquarana catesbeiana TaxID=8400 RepID=A0A2G9S6E4_AQUCT|nr:hypothetical protein AB205_0183190 [Aquarana catesbeiana]